MVMLLEAAEPLYSVIVNYNTITCQGDFGTNRYLMKIKEFYLEEWVG